MHACRLIYGNDGALAFLHPNDQNQNRGFRALVGLQRSLQTDADDMTRLKVCLKHPRNSSFIMQNGLHFRVSGPLVATQ